MLELLKFLGLMFGIWFGFVNISLVVYKKNVNAANLFIMALGLTTFIYIQFLM